MPLSSGILLPASPNWRAGYAAAFARADAGTGFLDALALGDSWVAGKPNATTPTQDAVSGNFWGMVASGIQSLGIDLAARHWGTAESLARESDAVYTSLNRGGAPWTINGTATQQSAGWPFVESSNVTGAFPANISHTYLSDSRARLLEFLVATYRSVQQSAKYSYRIDGGAPVQQTLKAAASDFGYDVLSLSGLASGIHTVDFGGQLASDGTTPQADTLYILGANEYYNVSEGLRWGRMAWSGRQMGDFTSIVAAGAASPSDKLASIAGGFYNSLWNNLGYPTCPNLLLVCLGLNDCNRGFQSTAVDPRGMYNALMYAGMMGRRARPDMTLIFVAPYLPPPSGDVAAFQTYQLDWPLYRRAIREAAADAQAACIDLGARWGSTAFASGYMSASDIHPLQAGHADIYSAIMEVLHG